VHLVLPPVTAGPRPSRVPRTSLAGPDLPAQH